MKTLKLVIRFVLIGVALSLDGLGGWPVQSGLHCWGGMDFQFSVCRFTGFLHNDPPRLEILFIVPWMIGISAISLLFFLVQMWKAADVSWYGRIQYLLMTASAFTTFWLANLWNLIH